MSRLITLDMLRGYALVSIMVNHMPISVMRGVTLPNFSIFDASELFVLLSGFLVGLVWRGMEARDGRAAAQRRFARRAFEVWRAMLIGAVLMAALSAALLALDRPHTAIWNQYARWIMENPLGYVGTVATFWVQPNIIDVLAVYVILIAAAVVVVPLMLRWPLLVAAASVLLWWHGPQLNALIPNHRSQGGFLFNPFGWQMLFFTGTALGLYRQRLIQALWPWRHLVTVLALGMFVFGSAIVIGARIGEPALPLREALKSVYGTIDKWSLDGTRYLAIVAAAWLVAVPLARPAEALAASRLGVALQQIGRGGLFAFVACVLLSVLGDAFQMTPAGQPAWRRLAVDLWACLALWWASALWLEHGAPWQRRRKQRRDAKRGQARA
ncbi:OpgC domain-containing protein [Paracoccus aestuarii]|uniref:OpgC domain-containing protein n=1 Tax=Paracoccus aestuarii TaxID=453842 RepID=A0A418ZTI4_9RHOB|nr:OpgC domain-containing protein [Paracoccus aestuarii]RJL00490.1 OpgC domain-containing protein [Paracoccus aestuarii]WCQ99946.1 OpgC domain-containing protein [Paracoccus aestuarii]